MFDYFCIRIESGQVRSGQSENGCPSLRYAIMIERSTYVGMINVRREEQDWKQVVHMTVREVGRDRLVSLEFATRETHKIGYISKGNTYIHTSTAASTSSLDTVTYRTKYNLTLHAKKCTTN